MEQEKEFINNQQGNKMISEDSEEEDDWNPTPIKSTILQKVKVDFSDKAIIMIEKKQDIKDKKKQMQNNIPQPNNDNQEQTKEKQQQQNGFKNKSNGKQKNNKSNNQNNVMEDDFFDEQDMESEDNQEPPEFYDPIKDEKYESWVNKNLKKEDESQIVLSCPFCFTQLCYDCQSHEKFDNQYRAIFVKNTKINTQKIVTPQEIQRKQKKKKQNQMDEEQNAQNMQNDDNFLENIDQNCHKFSEQQLQDVNFLEKGRKNFEIFFQTSCANCDTEIGVFEADAKVYIYHNVIPSLG